MSWLDLLNQVIRSSSPIFYDRDGLRALLTLTQQKLMPLVSKPYRLMIPNHDHDEITTVSDTGSRPLIAARQKGISCSPSLGTLSKDGATSRLLRDGHRTSFIKKGVVGGCASQAV